MSKPDILKFREQLLGLAERTRAVADSIEEQARQPVGRDAAGDLSNTPMHLGDVGSEAATQEIGAALWENEQYLQTEIAGALDRIEKGTFGRCENCDRDIAQARLKALPYARFCIRCAKQLQPGATADMNKGRPANWEAGIGLRAEGPPAGAPGGPKPDYAGWDSHAAGTPGGGTAIGGLAGTNVGTGEPDESDLEGAMGSSEFDVAIEEWPTHAERSADESHALSAFAGLGGGAGGGTPANKRTTGGKH